MLAESVFTAIIGLLAFAATNLDGLFLMVVALGAGKVNRGEAVWGQVAGTAVLMGLSVAGTLGAVLLPPEWDHWLGLIPFGVGVKQLWDAWRARPAATPSAVPAAPLVPRRAARLVTAALPAVLPNTRVDTLGMRGMWLVALLTVAHGGDNLAVYIALFANQNFLMDGLQIAIALAMAAAWGRLAAALVDHPRLGVPVKRAGPWLLPWVLIALGVLIWWPNS